MFPDMTIEDQMVACLDIQGDFTTVIYLLKQSRTEDALQRASQGLERVRGMLAALAKERKTKRR
jgi:hypothetical protein